MHKMTKAKEPKVKTVVGKIGSFLPKQEITLARVVKELKDDGKVGNIVGATLRPGDDVVHIDLGLSG